MYIVVGACGYSKVSKVSRSYHAAEASSLQAEKDGGPREARTSTTTLHTVFLGPNYTMKKLGFL